MTVYLRRIVEESCAMYKDFVKNISICSRHAEGIFRLGRRDWVSDNDFFRKIFVLEGCLYGVVLVPNYGIICFSMSMHEYRKANLFTILDRFLSY